MEHFCSCSRGRVPPDLECQAGGHGEPGMVSGRRRGERGLMPGTRKGLWQLRGQVRQEQVRVRPGRGLWGSSERSEGGEQGPRFGWAWTRLHPVWCPSRPGGPAGLVRERWPSPWMPGRLKGALAMRPKGLGVAWDSWAEVLLFEEHDVGWGVCLQQAFRNSQSSSLGQFGLSRQSEK